jgi:hypothetical protein
MDPTHSVQLLDRPIPPVVFESAMDPTVEQADLTVIEPDQVP